MMEQGKLLESLLNSFTAEERNSCEENDFPYLFAKAYDYIRLGPAEYRKKDAYSQPSEDLDDDELKAIESGCRQILEGRGLSAEKPFTGLDVDGFYGLFELFHYNLSTQSVNLTAQGLIDRMEMRHVVNKNIVTYYNLVVYEDFG